MNNQFLFDLYFHYMEMVPCPRDKRTQHAQQELDKLEEQLQKTMRFEFVNQYEQANFLAFSWQEEAAFLAGLRLGVQVMTAALRDSSDPVSST